MSPINEPQVGTSKPFAEVYSEGERFYLKGIRTVDVETEYGPGKMVLLTVDGQEDELGIWGKYLTAQAEAADESDMGKWYIVNRRVVPGFGKRAVKVLDPHQAPGQGDEDHPF